MQVNYDRMQQRHIDLVHRLAQEQDHVGMLLMQIYNMDQETAVVIAHQHRLGGPLLAQLLKQARGS